MLGCLSIFCKTSIDYDLLPICLSLMQNITKASFPTEQIVTQAALICRKFAITEMLEKQPTLNYEP